MPKITIVRPSTTPEQEKIIFRNIADVMEKIVLDEFGVKVKIELYRGN